jgi:Putative beta-barrel porin 2
MSLLAALVLAAASARVESVSLTTVDARLAVRVAVSGTPGMVAVHREGDVARVSIMDADLGVRFAGGRHFSWTPSDGFDPSILAATPARLDRLEIAATPSEVSLLLHVPKEASVDIRRYTRGLLILFRSSSEPERVAQGRPQERVAEPERKQVPPPPSMPPPSPAVAMTPPRPEPAHAAAVVAPPVAVPSPTPRVAAAAPAQQEETAQPPAAATQPPLTAPAAQPAPAPSSDTLELAKRLLPATPAEEAREPVATSGSVAELYSRLFPGGALQTQPETVTPAATLAEKATPEPGLTAGPFRVRASVDARYVDADSFVTSPSDKVRDQYLEVAPNVTAVAPVGEGLLTLDYVPVFRGLATYTDVNSSTQSFGAGIDLPVGSTVTVRAKDRFLSGTLDTRVADPGGEYFFGLGRFHRNDLDGGASILLGPRLSVELAGALGAVRFQETSNFFDYDTRLVSAGLGFELTPTLKAVGSYVYDTVPTPPERPEAEARAHSARLALTGEILPLLNGELAVGYRDQQSPNAGEGGTHYSGLVMSGVVTRQLRPDSAFSVYVSRSTPVSAFGQNAFYVSTALQGSIEFPLPAALQLRGGAGYQWNDYRTISADIGVPRADRILDWYVGLRRPIQRQLFLAASFRREQRHSNIDTFDSDANGFILNLEWDIFGVPPR